METLLVADSFRVRERERTAEARMPGLHLDRFREGVAAVLEGSVAAGLLSGSRRDDWWELVFEPFMKTAPERIAAGGAGFPRLQLLGPEGGEGGEASGAEPRLGVRIRPLPRLTASLELRSAPSTTLVTPRLKGPSIGRLAALNRELGAEALLLDRSGGAVEGATTSLLWWDGATLCATASEERVDSVTERLVIAIAERRGDPVERRSCRPDQIAAHEVWAVNALHGIRRATRIDGAPTGSPDHRRLADFRDALEDAWRPIDGHEDEDDGEPDGA